jgi:hypothetical protein
MHEIVGAAGLEYPNYDGMSIEKHQGIGPIYTFKNLIINKGKSNKHLSGKWMVIANPYYYGHYLQESIGPMLYYKNNIDPDINILWLNQVLPSNAHDSNSFSVIGKESLNLFKLDKDIVMTPEEFFNTEIVFENLITFFYSSRFVPGLKIDNYIFKDLFQHDNELINKELKTYYSSKLKEDQSLPKKIFLSRKKRSELIEKFNNGEDPLRHAPMFYHDAIENFFKSEGYEVLEMSGKTVVEQASYMYNATHIAGIAGTAFLNGIFAKESTKFYLIKSEINYSYKHELDSYAVSNTDFKFIEMYNKESYSQVYAEVSEKYWNINE